MPLVSLQTNLKSLKFGNDRKGGGSSNQPYIKKSLLDDDSLGSYPLLDGGILRTLRSADDVSRLTKFFGDTKSQKGIEFTLKQNILSRASVKTEASYGSAYGGGNLSDNIVGTGPLGEGIYLPTSTILQVGGVAFGTHLNKQGLDPTGIFEELSIQKYSKVVRHTMSLESNRLYKLYDKKILNYNLDEDIFLYEYSGGPGSTLGIGKTQINFSVRTGYATGILDFDKYLTGNKSSITPDGVLNKKAGSQLVNPSIILKGASAAYNSINNTTRTIKVYKQDPDGKNYSYQTQEQYENPNSDLVTVPQGNPSIYISGSLELDTTRDSQIGQKISADGNGLTLESSISRYKRKYGGLYKGSNPNPNTADIIPFYITTISNNSSEQNQVFYFPAHIDLFSDSLNGEWNAKKYLGRGEEFFTQTGFKRNMNLGFKIHPNNPSELETMWDHINSLAEIIMPDYGDNGFMRGNFIKLTIGNYVIDLPGILKGFNFNIIDENTSWDIDVKMPKFIEIKSFEFQPIHNFLPRTGTKLFGRGVDYK